MNSIYQEPNPLDIRRTVRDDITMSQMQISLFINNNKDVEKKRAIKIDIDTRAEGDGAKLTPDYMESFVDAMARVYSDNVQKINNYSFILSCYTEKSSLPKKIWDIMTFCTQRITECGISIDKIAFGESVATTGIDGRSSVGVKVYIAPFSISTKKSMLISRWGRFRLLLQEICRIITSK